ncbi:MAG: hypothetical protein LBP89_01365 [Helicobacteraceae bacterium]|jgi:hypothetical protein|nr:hypothetical protein [Helicobacteraceae bacterium]
MKTTFLALSFLFAAIMLSCDAQSLTQSGEVRQSASDAVEKQVTLAVGEHKDIELPVAADPTYAISSATESRIGDEVNLTNSKNVNYQIANIGGAARPVLRLVGAYPGKEAVVAQAVDRAVGRVSTLRAIVTVTPGSGNNDEIGGSPCVPPDCGGGGVNPPNPPGGGGDIGDGPIQDPDACITGGRFYYVDDNYQDVEGKFGGDFAAYIRSLMSGNVDSNIRLYYPIVARSGTIAYANLGRYYANLPDPPITVEFDLQLGQHLFGLTQRYFYVESNGYCLRGAIPGSFMTPPEKSLTWVAQ